MNKKKVLVAGHDLKFWNALQYELEKTGLFEFKQDITSGHNERDYDDEAIELIEWADILVAEWTLGNAVFFSKHKKQHQKLVCRFHLQERWTEFPEKIDYSKVDAVLFVGPHILRECVEKFNIPATICKVVGNFIDMDKFNLPKFGDAEFNIGMIGTVPARKRLDLAFNTLKELLKINSSYRLHVKGPSPDSYDWLWARTKEREYYQTLYKEINSSELRNHVIFDPAGKDVDFWLQKIGYILSPSDFESFHVAVSEGVSSSALPIVWNWEGADEIYPPFQLMNDAKNTARFIDISRQSNIRHRYLQQAKNLLNTEYSREVISAKWKDMLFEDSSKDNVFDKLKFNKILVVYAIANFSTFHRSEMLQALSKKLPDDTFILVVEPGSHFSTLLKNDLDDEASLHKFAKADYISLGSNIGRVKALYGSMPKEIEADVELKAIKTHKDAVQYFVKKNFGENVEIVHWLYKPNQINLVAGKQKYFYEVYDEYTMDFGTGEFFPEIDKQEKQVLADAEHVFFTSEPLSDRKKHSTRESSVISNGVVFDIFRKYAIADYSQSSGRDRQSIGYLGNLSNFFDWSLMLDICKKMVDVDFFFHGQIELEDPVNISTYEEIKNQPNTFFSGRVTRNQGAAAINRYDVLIIPFVINDAMHAVNPLKLWEYFATGNPVVSSPMDAINIDAPALRVARNIEDWMGCLQDSLNESKQSEIREQRIEMAKAVSWDSLVIQYVEHL